jgi:hypothetical protein
LIGEDRDTEVGVEKLDEILKGLDDVMQHD